MNGVDNNLTGILLVLVAALPLAASLLGYVVSARVRGSMAPAWFGGVGLLLSSGISLYLFGLSQGAAGSFAYSVPWLTLPGIADLLEVPLAFHAGAAQLIFTVTTGLIGLAVLIFAGRERREDGRRGIFFATLTLFAGAMLLFLTADTLILIYLAWELMGLCSYLLIAHPGTKEAWRAARQAFWTTRASDFGLFFAIITLMTKFGWMTLGGIDINAHLTSSPDPDGALAWMTMVALLVLIAVIGKVAQFPLSFWLPDAMVAPAPVSALLHAATMVAAGPYLMVRLAKFYRLDDVSMLAATIVGGLTLLLGAVMALCAREPKKILAYSTVSHLGLVVMSVGVLAQEFGFFHLITHAWFKAALFLGVGFLAAAWAREYGAGGEQPDLNRLAGFARRYPLVLWGILVPAGLSLAGVPFLAGALGKEQVLFALLTRFGVELAPEVTLGLRFKVAAAGWQVGSMMMVLALPLTAAYITRLVGILGFAKPVEEVPAGSLNEPKREPGWAPALWLSTGLAMIGSIGLSVWYYVWFKTPRGFVDDSAAWRIGELTESPYMKAAFAVSVVAVLAGILLTWSFRVAKPLSGDRVFRDGGLAPLTGFFRNGMYLRELFTTVVGRTGEFLAILAGIADIGFLDWLVLRCGAFGRGLAVVLRWVDEHIVDGLRWCVCEFVWQLKRAHARGLQTGQIQFYMLVVLISAVLLCFVIIRPLGEIMATFLGRM